MQSWQGEQADVYLKVGEEEDQEEEERGKRRCKRRRKSKKSRRKRRRRVSSRKSGRSRGRMIRRRISRRSRWRSRRRRRSRNCRSKSSKSRRRRSWWIRKRREGCEGRELSQSWSCLNPALDIMTQHVPIFLDKLSEPMPVLHSRVKQNWAGGSAQLVECSPYKQKTLGSTSSVT